MTTMRTDSRLRLLLLLLALSIPPQLSCSRQYKASDFKGPAGLGRCWEGRVDGPAGFEGPLWLVLDEKGGGGSFEGCAIRMLDEGNIPPVYSPVEGALVPGSENRASLFAVMFGFLFTTTYDPGPDLDLHADDTATTVLPPVGSVVLDPIVMTPCFESCGSLVDIIFGPAPEPP